LSIHGRTQCATCDLGQVVLVAVETSHTGRRGEVDNILDTLIAEHGGRVPVDAFMRFALFDSRLGYYRTRHSVVGRDADFATSATLFRWLGTALAHWLQQTATARGITHWIEVGAGDGALARTILSKLGWIRRRKVHYHIVEISEALREVQREQLKGFNVRWHSDLSSAAAACQGRALIFSNELVDAFPVIRLVSRGGQWHELFLEKMPGGGQMEVPALESVTPERVRRSVALQWCDAPDGQKIEVHASYKDWMDGWVGAFDAISMLTIDYGGKFPHLYYKRPSGTLRAYRRHARLTGEAVFESPGQQDITADVNFDDVRIWGEQAGLRTVSLVSQRDFVLQHAPRAGTDRSDHVRQWLSETGAGGAFQVLEQQK
jgi:SAM-dependent MidA family methyltransferase